MFGFGKRTKRVTRPLPKSDGDCPKGGKHVYQMYGVPYEVCVKCGKQHSTIIEWRQNLLADNFDGVGWAHPYVESGIWSTPEYKRYMSMKK